MSVWQDFGQRVSLTSRIREILVNYPEGTGLLKELFQNADDAGARQVKLCLDHRTHGAGSVAFEGLAEFQGPSLLVYNDALFSEGDFESISRVGDSVKRAQAGKTGRFGIGFNSCYHLTDLPTFVSGKHLVMFDPHCQHLPHISTLNPGKKMDFVGSRLAEHHPDQCRPLQAFGCDMVHQYQGTLFRFPLRTEAQAARSQISKQVYSTSRVLGLLSDLQREVHLLLLFLKGVEGVEVMQWRQGCLEPELLYSCSLRGQTPATRMERSLFLRASRVVASELARAAKPADARASASPPGSPRAAQQPLSAEEEAFKQRLMSSALQSSSFELELETVTASAGQTPLTGGCHGDDTLSQQPNSQGVGSSGQAELVAGEGAGPALHSEAVRVVRRYLLSQGCCGASSSAWRLAEEGTAEAGTPLVPWAAVALPLLGGGTQGNAGADEYQGQAFCFLPLPTYTGLPAHVNATFELSSNRRDLWHGRDMAGAGRRRALWNEALLGEAVAPLLAQAMELAAQQLGPTKGYYRLWPASLEAVAAREPFGALVAPFCKALAGSAVAYTAAGGGRWLTPGEALFLDDRSARDKALSGALLAAGLPIVTMPPPITRLLLHHLPELPALVTPQLVRERLRGRRQEPAISPHQAAALLEYCLIDLDETDWSSTAQLAGLAVLPLASGTVAPAEALPAPSSGQAAGKSRGLAGRVVYVPSRVESRLFAGRTGHLLLDVALLSPDLQQRLRLMAAHDHLNLRVLTCEAASSALLPLLLPPAWRAQTDVAADQQQPSSEWLQQLWSWLAQQEPHSVAALLQQWPLLPTLQGRLLGPSSLEASPALVPPQPETAEWASGLQQVVVRLGCRVVDTSVAPDGAAVRLVAHGPGGLGLLAGLHAALSGCDVGARFQELHITPEDRRLLREYLLQPRWFELSAPAAPAVPGSSPRRGTPGAPAAAKQAQQQGHAPGEAGGVSLPKLLGFLRRLPIFEHAAGAGEAFSDLQGDRCLPPSDLPLAPAWWEVLSSSPGFVGTASPAERAVMASVLGVRQLSRAQLYRDHVLPRIAGLSAPARDTVMLEVLQDLVHLRQIDPGLVDQLRQLKFVSTPGGSLAAPAGLHDPRSSELLLLLDPAADFPSDAFATALPALQQLGMMAVADPATVLRCARAIESLAATTPEQAASRGRALLAYLELEAPRLSLAASEESTKDSSAKGGASGALSAGGVASQGPASHMDRFSRMFGSFLGLAEEGQPPNAGSKAKAAAANHGAKAFWQQMQSIAWCPVQARPPVAGMPWRQTGEVVAPPSSVRPPSDTWLTSASLLILDGECRSSHLTGALGWMAPLSHETIAEQLVALGASHASTGDTATRQLMAGVVPQLYSALAALPPDQLAAAGQQLQGRAWVWVGEGFMPATRVAFRGPLNLSPWLYVIPLELAPFRELLAVLGVPPSFTAVQYCEVLKSMAEGSNSAPLDDRELQQALGIIAALADMDLPAEQLYVPNERGVLTAAGQLVYNDAPWLPGGGEVTLVHPKISNEVAERLGVASLRRSLLVRSGADSIQLGLTGAAMEAFGQSEALTTRLRHIIQAYADGPGVLMELIQNADDAGATTVAFMLDCTSYPTGSLLGPGMAGWQGPALLCFNDSVFSPSDFYAISRIGQDSKLSKPAATGRFGLGFNAVYHFTDVPSFVSGDYLVVFDPHAKYLPGVNPAQPGLKIGLPGSPLPIQFPDSFAPYQHFGCLAGRHFQGTLFRFPLRTEDLAPGSDIKPEAYTTEHVLALFKAFQQDAAGEVLLFLKSVRRVELHIKHGADRPPQLLLSADLEVGPASPPPLPTTAAAAAADRHPQSLVAQFVKGAAAAASGRESAAAPSDFYQQLAAVSEADLPRACTTVTISLTGSVAAGASGRVAAPGGGSGTSASTGDASPDQQRRQQQQWVVCSLLAGGRARRMAVEGGRVPRGGEGSRGWVPWAGAAAPIHPPTSLAGRAFCFLPLPATTGLPLHINGAFELSSNRRDLWQGADLAGGGKARALWNAALLADGVAPACIQVLLAAALRLGPGEAYYQLWPLAAHLPGLWALVADRVLDLALTQPLVWSSLGGGTWVAPSEAIFLPPQPPPASAQQQGQQGQQGDGRAARAGVAAGPVDDVARLLLLEGLAVVTEVPQALVQGLLRRHPSTLRLLSPSLVRQHFVGRAPASLACLQPFPSSPPPARDNDLSHASSVAAEAGSAAAFKGGSHSAADSAALLLGYCLSDMAELQAPPGSQVGPHVGQLAPQLKGEGGALAQLDGLPLLPLLDGGVAVLRTKVGAAEPFYVASQAQHGLLSPLASNTLLAPPADTALGQQLAALAGLLPEGNVRLLDTCTLARVFLPRLLPASWRSGGVVLAYTAGQQGHPTEELLQLIWGAVREAPLPAVASEVVGSRHVNASSTAVPAQPDAAALRALADWPLIPALAVNTAATQKLPASGGAATAGLDLCPCLCPPSPGLLEQGSWAAAVSTSLAKLGCRLVDPAGPVTQALPGWVRQACVQPATGAGALAAISAAAGTAAVGSSDVDMWRRLGQPLSAEERDALRAFLLQARWFGAVSTTTTATASPSPSSSMPSHLLTVLRSLPIWRRACASGSETPPEEAFCDLVKQRYLAPRSVPSIALPPTFVLALDDGQAELLMKYLGVTQLSRQAVVARHVLPRAHDLPEPALAAVVLPVLKQMSASPQAVPEAVRAAIRAAACVPTAAGDRAKPGELYDPRSHELKCLLGPTAPFPAESWAAEAGVLEGLAGVGMRSSLSPEVLLEVAKDIEGASLALPPHAQDASLLDRGQALLAALATLSATRSVAAGVGAGAAVALANDGSQPGQAPDSGSLPPNFWSQLAVVAFVPVYTQPPCEGLPWPSGSNLPLAPPKLVRPEASMWLVSASMRILAAAGGKQDGGGGGGWACPDHLAARLGWLDPPPVSVLAAQLLELGRQHGAEVADPQLQATLGGAASQLYGLLAAPERLGGQEGEVARVMLEGSAWVWTGEGFQAVDRVALDSPADFRPYLHTVPEDLVPHEDLFTALGVPATPTPDQYRHALACMASTAGDQPLPEAQLALALALAEGLAAALLTRQAGAPPSLAASSPPASLPDSAAVMAPSASLHYDDAPWLGRAGLRMVHASLAVEVAQALGAQSLRYHHQVDTQMTSTYPCTPAALVRQLLEQQQETGLSALFDVLEVADACGCTKVDFFLDAVDYPAQSLLQPELAAFQGPAICVALEGVVLSAEEVCRLQVPTTPFRLRYTLCGYGAGLMGTYALTDLPLVLAGDSLLMADPAGAHLSTPGAAGGAGAGQAASLAPGAPAQAGAGVVKQYRHAGSDLPSRFADQFSVWRWAGEGPCKGAQVGATLLRLPLRTQAQAASAAALSKAAWSTEAASALLDQLSASLPQCLLFLRSLRTVRVLRHTDSGAQLLCEATILQGERAAAGAAALDVQQISPSPSHRVWVDERDWRRKAATNSSSSSSSTGGGRSSSGSFFGRLAKLAAGGGGGGTPKAASSGTSPASSTGTSPADAAPAGALRHTQHQVVVTGADGAASTQLWAVAAYASGGQVAQLGAQLQLSPQAAVAVHLGRPPHSSGTALDAVGRHERQQQQQQHKQPGGSLTSADGGDLPVGMEGGTQAPAAALAVVKSPGLLSPLPLEPSSELGRLPSTLCATFALARSGGRRLFSIGSYNEELAADSPSQLKPRFNRELLRCAAHAWVALLEILLHQHQGTSFRDLYAMLPRCGPPESCRDPEAAFLVQQVYSLAARRPVWQVRAGQLLPVSQGCFLDAGEALSLSGPAREFVQQLFPLFDVPGWLKDQLEACGVSGLRSVTPPVVRDVLKRMAAEGRLGAQVYTPAVAADLLLFCTSDLTRSAPTSAASSPRRAPAPPSASPINNRGPAAAQLSSDGSAGAARQLELDLVALRDCNGLPIVTAGGRVRLLGSGRLLVWESPGKASSPLQVFAGHPAVLDEIMHPAVAQPMAALLDAPQAGSLLSVEKYSLRHAASHMASVLPAHWAPPGIGRPAPMTVAWSDGGRGGPPPHWLAQLWELLLVLQPDLSGPAWDPLSGWALLPCTTGDVLRLAHRHAVITPPVQQAAGGSSAADAVGGFALEEGGVQAGQNIGEQQQQRAPQSASGSLAVRHLEGPPSMGAHDGRARFEEPWESQLGPALAKMGCFVLDPRYLQCAPLCNSAYAAAGQQAAGPADQLQLLVRKLRATTGLGRLRVSALDNSDRQVVLEALGSAVATASPPAGSLLLPADVDFLRSLPLFATLAGSRVSLEAPGAAFGAAQQGPAGACSEQDVAAVFGSEQAVPLEVKERLLAAQPQLQPLYQMLNIPQLPPASLLLEALRLVGFAGVPTEARPAVLAFLDTHWQQLQGQAGALEVLRTASFVETVGGELAAPSSLYDPSNALLAKVFAGQQSRFPAASFATPTWLARLREAGLKQALDTEAVLAAARGIAARAEDISRALGSAGVPPAAGEVPQASPGALASAAVMPSGHSSWLPLVAGPGQRLADEAAELWEAACGLAGCLADGSPESKALLGGSGASRAFAEELRQVAFVPARLYVPAAPAWQPVLSRYQDCLAPKDWALAWSAAPTLHPCGEGAMAAGGAGGLPPSAAWSMLRLRSPPPFDAIMQHLQKVGQGQGEAALSAWPSPDLAPEQACEALLKYLHDEGLSAAQRQRLEGAAFVPVANATHLVSPGELFVRLPVDLAPLLWEVPPEFMPHLPLLKSLGTRDAPSPQDLLGLLASLHKPHATQPLTSVQLRGVINLLKQLLDDSTAPLAPETRQAVQAGKLPVPTADSLLAPAGQCLYATSAGSRAIMSRLPPGTLTLAHPQLPAPLCRALGMHPLHDVVREELDPSQLLQPLTAIQGTRAADIAARLRSAGFAAAVHSVLRVAAGAASSGGPGGGDASSSSLAVGDGAEGQQLGEEAVKARLSQAAGALQFVRQCSTHLVVSLGRSSSETPAPLQGSSSQVPCFVNHSGGHPSQMVSAVVLADLPPGIPLSASLAAVVTRVLLGRAAPCLPLAPLLDCALHDLPAVASIITGAGAGSTRTAELAAGGQGLGVVGDLEAQSAAGQVGAALTATDATALRLRPLRPFAAGELVAYQVSAGLRYGRVAADSRPPPAAAAYRLTVEVSPGAFKDLLSSELFSFVACQTSQAAPGQQGALHLPITHSSASAGPSLLQEEGQPDRHHGPVAASSQGKEGASAQAAVVPAAELVAAAQSMLAAAGIPLASDQAVLMSELATLQQQVQGAQRQLAKVAEANRTHQEEADGLRASWQCRVCLERQVDTVMSGCGHLLCEACSRALPRRNTCPFCRQSGQPMRIYK